MKNSRRERVCRHRFKKKKHTQKNTFTDDVLSANQMTDLLERLQTSDGLSYFGDRPIYKPQNTKLNYAHRQTNKTYKQQNTQTNKTDINKQTKTTNKQKADQTVTPG